MKFFFPYFTELQWSSWKPEDILLSLNEECQSWQIRALANCFTYVIDSCPFRRIPRTSFGGTILLLSRQTYGLDHPCSFDEEIISKARFGLPRILLQNSFETVSQPLLMIIPHRDNKDEFLCILHQCQLSDRAARSIATEIRHNPSFTSVLFLRLHSWHLLWYRGYKSCKITWILKSLPCVIPPRRVRRSPRSLSTPIFGTWSSVLG